MLIGHHHNLPVDVISGDMLWLQVPAELSGADGYPANGRLALPAAEARDAVEGTMLTVFVFTDPRGEVLATTSTALVERGACASLKVAAIETAGAFLDWGLSKHLLLPWAEQRRPLATGRYESVLVYLDNSGRLAASSRIDHHLSETPDGFSNWQQVDLLLYQRTDLGIKAVVDDRAIGLLYKDEIFKPVRIGDRVAGYVKRVREDGRLDLSLQPPARELHDDLSARILADIRDNDGICSLTDKSPPEAIYARYGVSKKNFKRAIGSLYRQRLIALEPDRIVLLQASDAHESE